MHNYQSLCEIGCFNGRITIILRKFLNNKKYSGYDLNFFAISIAKFINYFIYRGKNIFYCKSALNAPIEKSELFVSIGTLIYLSEFELKKFIRLLKKNNLFKAFVIHEIFLNEEIISEKKSFKEDNLYIHSISMIKEEFGKDFKIDIYRTYYSNWEKKEKISAILSIKKV